MSGINVEVTQEDISAGKPETIDKCPIALAIKRGVVSGRVRVQTNVASVNGVIYTLPGNAVSFIAEFDSQRTVEPFSFAMQEYRLDEGATKVTDEHRKEDLFATIREAQAELTLIRRSSRKRT